MQNYYTILAEPCFYEFEEKRSQFLCYLYPVEQKPQIVSHLSNLREEFADARHHCSAYILGDASQPLTQGFDDDGEPSGTAGRPMLNVLTQRSVGNCLAVVVRYFGGIKLGAGGLVRAYTQSVSRCVDIARLAECYPSVNIDIQVPYSAESSVRHLIQQFGGEVLECQYSEAVTLLVILKEELELALEEAVQGQTSGQYRFIRRDD